MKRADIQQALQKQVVEGAVVSHRFEGVKRLFDAACLRNDGPEADKYRFDLHAILDAMLDNSATTLMLTRQIMESRE